jgi:O-antigen ligase
LLLGIHALSIAWTPDGRGALLWTDTVFALACWFFLIASFVPGRRFANRLVTAATSGAVLAALIGILQHLQIEVPPFQQTLPPGSTFVYANVGAQALAPISALAFVMAIRTRRLLPTCLWCATFVTTLGYVVLTRCRGAWLGLAAALVFIGLALLLSRTLRADGRRRVGRAKLMIVCICILAAVSVALFVPLGGRNERRATWSGMLESFVEPLRLFAANPEEAMQSSASMRWHMLQCAVKVMRDRWLPGLGCDGFRAGIAPYLDQRTASLCYTPQTQMLTLHCDPLQVLVETGIGGGAALILIVAGVISAGYRGVAQARDADDRWLALAALAGLVTLAIHSLLSFPFRMPTSSLLGVTLAGVVVGLGRNVPSRIRPPTVGNRRVLLVLALLVVLAAIVSTIMNINHVRSMHHTCIAWAAKRANAGGRALHEINAAMAASDLHYSVRREFGVIHARFGLNRAAARQAVLRALADDPHYINNLVNVAGIELDLGRYADARAHLRQALAINDELHLAHYALGMVALAEGRAAEAIRAFDRALAIRPRFKPARQQLDRLSGIE